MSRKSNSTERRAQIVSALLATMAEHGYEKATIQLIAKKADLAPGLLHYHFAAKADMLLELVKMLAAASRARYAQLAAPAVDARARLHAYLEARLGLGQGADAGAVAAWVMIGAEAVRQPEVQAVYRDAVDAELTLLRTLLEEAMAEQGRPAGGAGALAAGVLALMEGAFQLACAAPGVLPAGFAATSARQLVDRFLEGGAPECRLLQVARVEVDGADDGRAR